MKIILLEDVAKLGKKYDIRSVSDGYALNFLIPQKAAESATKAKIRLFEELKRKSAESKKVLVQNIAEALKALSHGITISARANEKGHLFAGITKNEIAAELARSTGKIVDESVIGITKPIKEIGNHTVLITIGDQELELNVSVVQQMVQAV